MKKINQLILISIISGIILAGVLKVVQWTLNIQSYVLLFNMDYIPLLRHLEKLPGSGYVFHFVFCIVSVLSLFCIGRLLHLEASTLFYSFIFTIGSGLLYFLTALTDKPPSATSFESWLYWISAHAIFGVVVGGLIRRWVIEE